MKRATKATPTKSAPAAAQPARPLQKSLERAVARAKARDFDAALDAMLDAWRALPIPSLAERVERLAARLPQPAPADTARRWSALARGGRSSDLDALLATIFEGTAKHAIERMELLVSWPADPRLDMFVARVFEKVPYRATSARPFWVRLMRRQPQMRDARVLPILDRCLASYGDDYAESYLKEQIGRLLRDRATLEEHGRASLPDPAASLLARFDEVFGSVKTPSSSGASVEALLEDVLKHPADDDLRQVLGDALAQKGDVRGELIALQFLREKGPLSVAQQRRERQILADDFTHLVGPLAPVVLKKGARFEKGFLAACCVKTSNPRHVEAASTSPWWATVEHIEGPSQLFFQPVMRSLRSITMGWVDAASRTRESVRALCAQGLPKLEQLQCKIDEESAREDLDALLGTKQLPALEALSVTLEPGAVARLFKSPLAARLQHLRLCFERDPATKLTEDIDPLRWRGHAEALGLRSFEMDVGDRRTTTFAFVRDDAKKLSRVTIELDVDLRLAETCASVVGVLERLKRSDVETLVVRPRQRVPLDPSLQALVRAAERLGGTLDPRPAVRASAFH